MASSALSLRDRIQIINSVLFCVVGAALTLRYFLNPGPWIALALGLAFLFLGVYRLLLARREWRRRTGNRA